MNKVYKLQLPQERSNDSGTFPAVVLIDTTSVCNLKCSMCVHKNMKRKKGFMKWELFTKIIDEIVATDKNVRVWMVFFGEALILRKKTPSIFDMIKYAKDKGLTDVVLNSNGTLLDKHAACNLISSGLNSIYIGLDAFTSETYSKLRVGGNYSKTVKNVLNLLKLKESSKTNNPEVIVQFVEMDINQNEKKDFINFWTDKGAKVKIRPKIGWGGLIDTPNQSLDNGSRYPCYWAMCTMSITDNGNVVLCAVDLDARYIAGNVVNNTLQEVWSGNLKKIRSFHQSSEYEKLPDFCAGCRDWQSARADFYNK